MSPNSLSAISPAVLAKICQWNLCDVPSAKHVRCGLNILPDADGPCGSAITTLPHHFDLCEEHVELVKPYYHNIAIGELGCCPAGCDQPELSFASIRATPRADLRPVY